MSGEELLAQGAVSALVDDEVGMRNMTQKYIDHLLSRCIVFSELIWMRLHSCNCCGNCAYICICSGPAAIATAKSLVTHIGIRGHKVGLFLWCAFLTSYFFYIFYLLYPLAGQPGTCSRHI